MEPYGDEDAGTLLRYSARDLLETEDEPDRAACVALLAMTNAMSMEALVRRVILPYDAMRISILTLANFALLRVAAIMYCEPTYVPDPATTVHFVRERIIEVAMYRGRARRRRIDNSAVRAELGYLAHSMRRVQAAKRIQRHWREVVADPYHPVGQRRLKREFEIESALLMNPNGSGP